jgi:hypothetical protein
MVPSVRAWGLLALGLAAVAVPCRADEGVNLFDGAGKAALALPAVNADALKAAAAAGRPAAQAPAPKRSSADLYYFTPAEAAAGRKKFAFRAQARKSAGFTFDADVPADIQKQMLADLDFIKGIAGSGASALHQQIFGSVDGPTYIKFFNDRVTAIGMNDCGSDKAVACVIPFEDPSKMWLTQNFIKFSHPQISRMMVVFHESRHTESQNSNWPHATCPTPFLDANGNDMKSIWTGASLAGEPACDVTPFGSYGSSTIMLKNIQKFCTNCSDKVKMDAGLYADDQMGRITDAGAKQQMQDDLYK